MHLKRLFLALGMLFVSLIFLLELGAIGRVTNFLMKFILGDLAFFFPILLVVEAYRLLTFKRPALSITIPVVVAMAMFYHMFFFPINGSILESTWYQLYNGSEYIGAGLVGAIAYSISYELTGQLGSIIVMLLLVLLSYVQVRGLVYTDHRDLDPVSWNEADNHDLKVISPPDEAEAFPDVPLQTARRTKELTINGDTILETLYTFGIEAKIKRIIQGPAITRYEIQPKAGTKLSQIRALSDELALALGSQDIRVEAPIPGTHFVGIEVPNKEILLVTLKDVIESVDTKTLPPLSLFLGKDVAGNPVTGQLNEMPHLLVAGATGSGKSVSLNVMILSLILQHSPDEVQLVLIDPKRVELTEYEDIPHLFMPVVTDVEKAVQALQFLIDEMERRYQLFEQYKVRNIERFNETGPNKLPYIVVIIDELADLMMVAKKEMETLIARLAQKARASGIHLIVATQRPSTDVITGTIKVNIPSRIAFAVTSQYDSKTILDMGGAETLLGKGDMLYYPVSAPKPIRVQGAYVSDQEVKELIEKVKKEYADKQRARFQ